MTENEKIERDCARAFGWLFAPIVFFAFIVYGYYENDFYSVIIGMLFIVFAYVPIIRNMKKSKRKRDIWIESRQKRSEHKKLEDVVQENNYFHNMK